MVRAPDDKLVRLRNMLWFEFDMDGPVEKVVSVHDVAVVLACGIPVSLTACMDPEVRQ